MWKHNDGSGESNIIQNRFTAYLETAIHRKKTRYQQDKRKRQYCEISLEEQEYLPEPRTESDMLENLPVLERLENFRLQCALEKHAERNLYIFFARALYGYSFVEIAAELEMEYKTVTMAYYRMIARIRKELRGDGV